MIVQDVPAYTARYRHLHSATRCARADWLGRRRIDYCPDWALAQPWRRTHARFYLFVAPR